MRKLAKLLAITAVCATGCSAAAPEQASTRPVEGSARTSGLDPTLTAQTVAAAERLPRLNSLLVLRDGKPIVERRFRGAALDQPANIKSASKTIMSALVGIAIERGTLSGADQTVASVLGSDLPSQPDPRLRQVTVGNLLSMQAGLERTSGEYYGRWVASPNWVRYALSRPFVAEPGGPMLYSTGNTHLLSAMLTRASGRSTHALAQEWLARPLGIAIPTWSRDPQGVYFGGNEMRMSPRGLARFGEMYRLGGAVDGRQVVSKRWVEESWRPRAVSPWSGQVYGYGWFNKDSGGHAVHFAWGYGGQMLFVVPDLRLTIVMTSDPSPHPRAESHLPALHTLLDQGLIPAAERGA